MTQKLPNNAVALRDIGTYLAMLYGKTAEEIAEQENITTQAVYQRLCRARKAIDVGDVIAVVESSLLNKVQKAGQQLDHILNRDLSDDTTGVRTNSTLKAIQIIYDNTLKHYHKIEQDRVKAIVDKSLENKASPDAVLDSMDKAVKRMAAFIEVQRANQPVEAEYEAVDDEPEPVEPVDSVQGDAIIEDNNDNDSSSPVDGGGGVAP